MDNGRDTSRDGLKNKVEFYALTHFKPLWHAVQRSPRLRTIANKALVNKFIYKIPTRPYPFSTMSSYTSWDSLVDRTWSGLHLPPLDWRPVTGASPMGITVAPTEQFERNLPLVEDLEVLFRNDGGTKYSSKSSLLFPYFVQWFTEGFLRTDRGNQLRNVSNHHIDLCTVYGLHPTVTHQLRSHQGGKMKSQVINGEEWPTFYFDEALRPKDEFDAIPALPSEFSGSQGPRYSDVKKAKLFAMGVEVDRANVQTGVVMLNVLCLREHNRLCDLMAAAYPAWDDERLFQTARNTLIVEITKVVINDYINHIAPYHFNFVAEPQSFYDEQWYRLNWMTVEFSLVYRWHSMLSSTLTHDGESVPMVDSLWSNDMLLDHGLGAIFEETARQPAAKLGLFNTPDFLLPVEMASVQLGRRAKLRSYNDYRELLEFPRVTSFDQISSDERVRKELERLYGHVDNVELYVGLYAEDLRPNSSLPPMVGRLVGIDAFSQALTNPLLSQHVYNPETFSPVGWREIQSLETLSDLVHRNVPEGRRYRIQFGLV